MKFEAVALEIKSARLLTWLNRSGDELELAINILWTDRKRGMDWDPPWIDWVCTWSEQPILGNYNETIY